MAKEKTKKLDTYGIDEKIEALLAGDRRSAARLITLVENESEALYEIMSKVFPNSRNSTILGITGPGGAGKSTLIDHLITEYRKDQKTIGVVSIDPSSPFSGGAFLGDRIRMQKHSNDPGVYIRSLASRGHLGGLSRATYNVIRILEAMGADIILVETLGAGQDEIEVHSVAHTCLLVVTPGMGDDIQAMKSGILEIADIIVVNKSDMEGADTCFRSLVEMLSATCSEKDKWMPRLISTVSAARNSKDIKGIDELIGAIAEHQTFIHSSGFIEKIKFERVKRELEVIFKTELQNYYFNGYYEMNNLKDQIEGIIHGERDPYTLVKEFFNSLKTQRKSLPSPH